MNSDELLLDEHTLMPIPPCLGIPVSESLLEIVTLFESAVIDAIKETINSKVLNRSFRKNLSAMQPSRSMYASAFSRSIREEVFEIVCLTLERWPMSNYI